MLQKAHVVRQKSLKITPGRKHLRAHSFSENPMLDFVSSRLLSSPLSPAINKKKSLETKSPDSTKIQKRRPVVRF